MMIKTISGRHAVSGLVGISACLLLCNTAFAWQQEYIVSDAQNNTAERYTWDADHQPRYEDILAERIQSSQNSPGLALAVPSGAKTEASMSVGWNFPVSARVTTGPVMAWRYDGSTPMMVNEFGDSATTQGLADPLWHASVSTLGWRVNTRYGDLRPWAQISYNQQFGENQWKSQFGMPQTPTPAQNGNWMDVTVGTDIPFNTHMAAYASLAQGERTTTGEEFLYTLGVSANF
ncbi:autotransporter domain-containing protein [Enterobacter chuandaensis]|uniref:Autotransporter domain-containing protein n=1 Tax=Enterobacter chuandaensis TaxID=2497875 RepID=A0AA96M296_9ENTR|nr:autotransporter domain-containing protein [Enterobacter chuandaensis]MCW4784194.1 autotransporter domain-containing protein [Enterobacter chuandaensis]MDA4761479.1 autotransporter domain-containing protein [Enterobacter chuandaensis]RJL00181.1 autotransporter domain-containing protein [Enterobacter chuandaensis]WNS38179.1 autotransporter domain-containing protein [Enterobacter chuandaensis]